MPAYPETFGKRITIDKGRTCRHTDPIVELFQLAEVRSWAKEMEPELERLGADTALGYEKVFTLFKNSDLKALSLDWSSMTVKQVRWAKPPGESNRISNDSLPSPQDWFDAYVSIRVTNLLNKLKEQSKP